MRRVVVTGMGCVTPLGADPASVWTRLTEGESGVGPITLFDASHLPVHIAAEVRDWSMAAVGESPDDWKHFPRQSRFALGSAITAGNAAGLRSHSFDPMRLGVYLGCGEIFPDFARYCRLLSDSIGGDVFDAEQFGKAFLQLATPQDDLVFEPGAPVGHIAGRFNAQGPSANYTTACVSSSVAIGQAFHIIQQGDADVMFAGGAHSMIHPFGITGFHRLSTLTTRQGSPQEAYRPFDRDRDGFVVGEGGAVFVLEDLDHALARNAEILAEVKGYGASHDAYRITDPREDGRDASRCLNEALTDSGLNPEDVDYINAHGSGTKLNDRAETASIRRALGEHAKKIPVSSTKAATGHLTTACGAMEFLACVLTVQYDVVPPTLNYEHHDPDCDLDFVPKAARDVVCRNVVNLNLGFGGHHAALVVSQFDT